MVASVREILRCAASRATAHVRTAFDVSSALPLGIHRVRGHGSGRRPDGTPLAAARRTRGGGPALAPPPVGRPPVGARRHRRGGGFPRRGDPRPGPLVRRPPPDRRPDLAGGRGERHRHRPPDAPVPGRAPDRHGRPDPDGHAAQQLPARDDLRHRLHGGRPRPGHDREPSEVHRLADLGGSGRAQRRLRPIPSPAVADLVCRHGRLLHRDVPDPERCQPGPDRAPARPSPAA